MINPLSRFFDWFAGRGEFAVTIPVMDGPLLPNNTLETAATVIACEAPDNLVCTDGGLIYSCGDRLMQLRSGIEDEVIATFPDTITAIAAGPGGLLAIALNSGAFYFLEPLKGSPTVDKLAPHSLRAPTALLFLNDDEIIVVNSSKNRRATEWQRDLLEMRPSGSVLKYNRKTGQVVHLARDLDFPAGVCRDPQRNDSILATEAGRYRLLRISLTGKMPPEPVLHDLPGYPFRIASAMDGGLWLSVVAPRSQLIEFVLRETQFRRRMLNEIEDPDLWISPALGSGRSFLEPLQAGAVKQLGILKPWAPSRSYGLVVKLDGECRPVASYHSRADGKTHGITSSVERDGALFATSKGGGRIISIPMSESSMWHA